MYSFMSIRSCRFALGLKQVTLISLNKISTTSALGNADKTVGDGLSRLSRFKHIKFMPSMAGLGSHQDFDRPSSKKATLVVLCGWLSANERNLNKYVQLWHKMDIDVLRVSTRWMDLLSPQLTMGRAAPKVAAALNDIRSIYPNIIFHVMSSGGYFYASMVDHIVRDDSLATLKPNLKGLVADSLADWPWILSNKRALSETLSPAVISMLPTKKINEILSNKQECPPMLRTSPANLEYFIYRNKIIRQNPLKLPVLLLFSRIDALCNMDNMFSLTEEWHRQGITVITQCWPDAPHVQLYRNYPQEYAELIDSFVNRVIS